MYVHTHFLRWYSQRHTIRMSCTYVHNAQAVQYSTYFEKENFSTEKPTVGTMSRTWVYNKSESMSTTLHLHGTNTTILLTRKCTVGNMAYITKIQQSPLQYVRMYVVAHTHQTTNYVHMAGLRKSGVCDWHYKLHAYSTKQARISEEHWHSWNMYVRTYGMPWAFPEQHF